MADNQMPDIERRGSIVLIDLRYPRLEGQVSELEIGLDDVRAADSIRIRYDFIRDGWSIFQASKFAWPADDPICDMDWQEVAFIEAWAREKVSS